MRQHGYGRDTGLTFRMFFTMFMLAGLWVVFMGLLFWAGISPILIFGFALIGVLIQYFMSDKLVLMSTGAREVTAQEEPWLHATIERLLRAVSQEVAGEIVGHRLEVFISCTDCKDPVRWEVNAEFGHRH